jgi:hypothetical protein
MMNDGYHSAPPPGGRIPQEQRSWALSAKREEGRLRAFVAANSFAGSEELGSDEVRNEAIVVLPD